MLLSISYRTKKTIGFAFCCFLVAMAVWHWTELQYKKFYKQLSQGREIVAQIRFKQHEVSRNFQGTLVWQPIEKDQNIFLNNSIQTGPQSSAEITLVTGSKVTLGPNSIIRFDKQEDEFILDLLNGKIMVQDDSSLDETSIVKKVKSSSLLVKTNNGNKLKIQNSQIKIDSTETKDVKIEVLKGQIQMTEKSFFKKSEKLEIVKNIEFSPASSESLAIKFNAEVSPIDNPIEQLVETTPDDLINATQSEINNEVRQPSNELTKPTVKVPTPKLKQIKVKVNE